MSTHLQRRRRRINRQATPAQEIAYASDAAKDLAYKNGLLHAGITGTGKDGKITVADVRAAIAARSSASGEEE